MMVDSVAARRADENPSVLLYLADGVTHFWHTALSRTGFVVCLTVDARSGYHRMRRGAGSLRLQRRRE